MVSIQQLDATEAATVYMRLSVEKLEILHDF